MSYNVDRFNELNRKEWTNPFVVDGWRKWHEPFTEWVGPITQKMVLENCPNTARVWKYDVNCGKAESN